MRNVKVEMASWGEHLAEAVEQREQSRLRRVEKSEDDRSRASSTQGSGFDGLDKEELDGRKP